MWLRIKTACLACCMMLFFCLPVHAEESEQSTSAESEENEKISISVSIYESGRQEFLAGPLTLRCPAESTAISVLEILYKYSYLDDLTLRENGLYAMTISGRSSYANSESGEWLAVRNGDLLQEYAEMQAPLEEGDSIEWIYQADDAETLDIVSEGDMAFCASLISSGQSAWNSRYNGILGRACDWLKTRQKSPASLFTLGAAGVVVDHKYLSSIIREISENESQNASVIAENILAVSFCGISAENVSDRNLVKELADCPDLGRSAAPIALAAADCNGYALPDGSANDRRALLNLILAGQNEDGSFSSQRGSEGSVSATAMALTVLSHYCDEDSVRQAVDKGVEYLADAFDAKSCGFIDPYLGMPSSRLNSDVLIAMSSLGIALDDERFTGNGENMLEVLFDFQNENGGFSNFHGGSSDDFSTRAAILAMTAQKGGRNPYFLRSPVTGAGTPVFNSSSETEKDETESVPEPEQKPSFSISFLIGSVGLAVGLLLGAGVLYMVIKTFRKIDRH